MASRLVRLSKLMALILRHEPERFGIVLDPEGFTPVGELLEAVRKEMPDVVEADIRAVVETVEPQKQRYSIEDGDVRANYGHSVADRIAFEAAEPPEILFHGTGARALETILLNGLHPMNRQYVHLTEERDLALRVGGRHGKPRIVEVAAKRAPGEGVRFYQANKSFWLADKVPSKYLSTEAGQ